MNMTLLSAYILSVMMLLLTPGPVVALITGTAARYGYRSAFATAVGTNGASLILIAVATLMLRGVVSLSPVWLSFIGLAGCGYIGYAVQLTAGRIRSAGEVFCGALLRGSLIPKTSFSLFPSFPSSLR